MICFWFNTPRRLKAIEIVLSGPGISVKIPKIIGLFLPDQSLGRDHQVTANLSVQLGGLPCVHDWLCHPQRWKISSVDLTALPRLDVTEIDKRIGHWTQFQKPSCAFGYGSIPMESYRYHFEWVIHIHKSQLWLDVNYSGFHRFWHTAIWHVPQCGKPLRFGWGQTEMCAFLRPLWQRLGPSCSCCYWNGQFMLRGV